MAIATREIGGRGVGVLIKSLKEGLFEFNHTEKNIFFHKRKKETSRYVFVIKMSGYLPIVKTLTIRVLSLCAFIYDFINVSVQSPSPKEKNDERCNCLPY